MILVENLIQLQKNQKLLRKNQQLKKNYLIINYF